ncbi:phosphatidylserine decarboxylase proenzyme 1 mitochondrial [Prunus yedoensis var. nudiflora]|uniref:phosphatidylserine decarboxylase n=1 Tax=Prunus yedoensis var. nudiflora TaxID=2094558 RepID=A0A314YNL9_PRUYE|nr:phosphatidylserine decarboxylase proenzyme 1 mitochondrial [Prunus yedoensis var. nudiflora]
MKFRASHGVCIFPHSTHLNSLHNQRRCFASFLKKLHKTTQVRSFSNGGGGGSKGDSFLLPGATVATLLMLGALHVRRMYDDRKVYVGTEKGTEFEFQPDVKSTFLRLLPLRSISRCWGLLTSVEIPVSLRPYVYGAWARAFHSNLEEAAFPLDEYASLREFFVRTLKEGSRPIDPDPQCLVSPVDAFSLLGASSFLPLIAKGDVNEESCEPENASREKSKKSWLRVSLASPKVWDPVSACPMKGLFYCVIYLKPGDYHRIHAPADWNVLVRRHFSGRLLPVNERATRTIRNLYVENERVVLEGLWKEGFMALAAVGATNIGSIELSIEPELRTNQARKKLLHSEPPEDRIYEPDGIGRTLKKGDEVAAFNMGSTVVLVFQAPISLSQEHGDSSSEFRFSVQRGDRVRVGKALGRWQDQ